MAKMKSTQVLRLHEALHKQKPSIVTIGNKVFKVDSNDESSSVNTGNTYIMASHSQGARFTWVFPE